MKDILIRIIDRTDDAVIGAVVLFSGFALACGITAFLCLAGNALLEWSR